MNFRARLAAGLVASVCVILLATTGREPTDNGRTNPTTTRCTEDMACWQCADMGNHRCGRP